MYVTLIGYDVYCFDPLLSPLIVIIVQNRSTASSGQRCSRWWGQRSSSCWCYGCCTQESFDNFVHYDLFFKCIATALSLLLIILTTIVHALLYIIAWSWLLQLHFNCLVCHVSVVAGFLCEILDMPVDIQFDFDFNVIAYYHYRVITHNKLRYSFLNLPFK